MGTTTGHIEQYRPDNELFSSYLERVDITNDIKNEQKKGYIPQPNQKPNVLASKEPCLAVHSKGYM